MGYKTRQGVAALIAVVIIASAGLVLAMGAIFFSLDHMAIAVDRAAGTKALSAAEGCLRLGLRRLALEGGYNGESLSLGSESCIITVTGIQGARIIRASATVGEYIKTAEADVVLSGGIPAIRSYRLPDSY